METAYTFRNIDATDGMRDHATQKLKKLDRFLIKPVSAHVVFHVERHEHVVEISLLANGSQYVGTERSADMYSSIDGAVNKILRQLKRDRDRQKDHKG